MQTDSPAAWEKIEAEVSELAEAAAREAPACHDFDHTLRVLRNAERLAAELPEADRRIVRLAALLHDIARPEELKSRGRICHAEAGARRAAELLAGCDLPEEAVRRVAAAVKSHRFRDDRCPASLEAAILYDADKLDSLGAVGVGRAFLFAGREGAKLHNTAAAALASEAYSCEDTAYREYLVKLKKLPAAMLTAPGRRLAAERLRFMDEFFAQLDGETGLNHTEVTS